MWWRMGVLSQTMLQATRNTIVWQGLSELARNCHSCCGILPVKTLTTMGVSCSHRTFLLPRQTQRSLHWKGIQVTYHCYTKRARKFNAAQISCTWWKVATFTELLNLVHERKSPTVKCGCHKSTNLVHNLGCTMIMVSVRDLGYGLQHQVATSFTTRNCSGCVIALVKPL